MNRQSLAFGIGPDVTGSEQSGADGSVVVVVDDVGAIVVVVDESACGKTTTPSSVTVGGSPGEEPGWISTVPVIGP